MTAAPLLLLNLAGAGAGDPVASAGAALAAGFDGVGLPDSPRLYGDPFVLAERVLSALPAAHAGPCVASAGLRHPVTVSAALRTLAEGRTGRAFAVVGRGESSVRNEGLAVPSLAQHVEHLQALRARVPDPERARLLGAASGPRTISATSTALGGVLLDVGVDPGLVARAAELARGAGARTAWLFLRAVVTSTPQQASAAAEPLLGSCAARLAGAPDWYGVGPAELDRVRRVAQSHDYARHGTAGARSGRATDPDADRRVRDRFVLTGEVDELAERLRPLAGLGLSGVVVAGGLQGVLDRLPELGRALRSGLATGAPTGGPG